MMVRPDRRREEYSKHKGPTKRRPEGNSISIGQKVRRGVKSSVDENSEVIKTFRTFQSELDAKHAKNERLVKLSRDVTIESKRIIFLLHRITSEDDKQTIIKEAQAKIEAVQSSQLLRIAQELEGEDSYLYQRAVSPGYQEYVEAVLFQCYVTEKRLMGLDEIQSRLTFRIQEESDSQERDTSHAAENPAAEYSDQQICATTPASESRTLTVHISPLDYVLGIGDFSGELMRMCINSIGCGDTDTPFVLVAFLRALYDSFQSLGNRPGREYVRKLSVMRQSVSKVENACYMLKVRGSEMPKHMLLDAISSLPDVNSAQSEYET